MKKRKESLEKTCTYIYQMSDSDRDDPNGRIEFNLGNTNDISDVYISNVSIKVKEQFTPDDSKKPLTDGNYIYNGGFQEEAGRMENWIVQDTASHAQCLVTDLEDGRRFKVITTECANIADVTLKQVAVPLATNGKYVLNFEAEADQAGTIVAHIAGNEQSFDLSPEKKMYTFSFEAGDVISEADFIMDLGINGTVYLDNIRIDEDSLIKNGSFNAGLSGYEDWTPYVQEKADLTSDYQTLTKTFQMKYDTDEQSILSISMGAIDGVKISDLHRICIDNISLVPATPEEIEAATPTIPSIDANTEMIKNGNFAAGEANWISAVTTPGAATATFVDGKAVYNITDVGTADWNVQLKQDGITLENGCTYRVKFMASSTEARTIKWAFLNPTYVWYGGEDVCIARSRSGKRM